MWPLSTLVRRLLPTGASHIIRGKGTIIGFNGATLINNGTITGDDPAGSMQVDLSNLSNLNNGTLKAGNGGTIDQTGGGTFLVDGTGSLVQFATRSGTPPRLNPESSR